MDACAKRGKPDDVLLIFEKMRNSGLNPDSTSYNTVLDAFARGDEADSADRAWDFLCRMNDDKLSGLSNVDPTNVSYSSVINAFARASGRGDGGIHIVKKANGVYEKLIEGKRNGTIHGTADPYANSCFLNCCANIHGMVSEKREALVMAIKAFEEMKQHPNVHGEPNQYTYGTMMKVCVRLTSNDTEKCKLMESLFLQACNRGLLSNAVLHQFLRNTPNHISSRVILSQGASKRDIPQSWYRHVPKNHWPTNDSGYDKRK